MPDDGQPGGGVAARATGHQARTAGGVVTAGDRAVGADEDVEPHVAHDDHRPCTSRAGGRHAGSVAAPGERGGGGSVTWEVTMDPLLPVLHVTIDELDPELVVLRRDLHAHPELSRLEVRTSRVVAERLRQAGLEPHELDGSGVVVDLGAEHPTYRVALRADLDALPVPERTGLPWASTCEGVAHACGHDLHTTVVLGAGLALATQQQALADAGIAVRLIFQPAEEVIPGGAHEVIDGGWLDGVDEVFALHSDPGRDVGEVGLLVGPSPRPPTASRSRSRATAVTPRAPT